MVWINNVKGMYIINIKTDINEYSTFNMIY